MDDYIKREDAIKSIIRNDHTDVSKEFKRMFAEEMLSYVKDKDVVSIVRCKDCASFHYSGMGGDNGILYCAKLLTEMQPTDFCSYGERKDDE